MTPQAERLLRYFGYVHLKDEDAKQMSSLFASLAHTLAQRDAADPAEQTVALRKLLEAKDAAVRCLLPLAVEARPEPPGWADPRIFREGWDAALRGDPSSTNPYAEGGSQHGAWICGFSDALEERAK